MKAMSRNFGPAHAALISLLVGACTFGAPVATAPPTAVRTTPAVTRSPQPTMTAAPGAEPSPAGVSCAGDDLLWELLPPPAQAYALAWLEGEQAGRVALLEEAMAADSSYADPGTVDRVSGLPAIAQQIGVFQEGHEGHFFRVRAWAPTDEHHDYVRVRWILCRQTDGRIVLEGEDILVLDEAGLIRQATRFVDP
jgi:hypothetical protein